MDLFHGFQQAQAISVDTKLLKVMLQWNSNVKACIVQEIIDKRRYKHANIFRCNTVITADYVESRLSQKKCSVE